jgi:DNA polymerase-3 subunit gamma/tau
MVDNQSLITKYRPTTFDEVFGHDTIIEPLKRALSSATSPHCFLLTGPSGVGKTTIARIIAHTIDAEVREADSASNSGVDAMRTLIEMAEYLPMTGKPRLMLILDECHRLSRNAWDVALKTFEEPPNHLFVALCTTEAHKVPATMLTRAYPIALKPLRNDYMNAVIQLVCELENWEVPGEVKTTITSVSNGSPRMALNLLQATHDMTNREEVLAVANVLDSTDALKELVNLLLRGNTSWLRIREMLEKAEIEDFNGAAERICGYLAAVMVRAETEESAQRAWLILDAFLFPTQTWSPKAAFFDAIGKVFWMGK